MVPIPRDRVQSRGARGPDGPAQVRGGPRDRPQRPQRRQAPRSTQATSPPYGGEMLSSLPAATASDEGGADLGRIAASAQGRGDRPGAHVLMCS